MGVLMYMRVQNESFFDKMEEKNHNIVVLEKTVNDGTEALTPEHFSGLKIGKRSLKAVGLPAIVSSVQHAFKWMNAGDAVKTMFKINQKGGFDCPGCAWPDPDDERSKLGEYCENGITRVHPFKSMLNRRNDSG